MWYPGPLSHLVVSRNAALIALNLILLATVTWWRTGFHAPADVLSTANWGAGVPSTSAVTAFATLRPWWQGLEPGGVALTQSGAMQHVVRVPRDDVRPTKQLVLPTRGIGYDALLGAVTAVRSLASFDLVFDWPLVVRLQQWLLLLALTLAPLALLVAHASFRRPATFGVYNAANLVLLFAWPNRDKFLTEGVIDNALANALAVVAVLAFALVLRGAELRSRRQWAAVLAPSLFLSFCPLVRGEFLPILVFVYGVLALTAALKHRRRLLGLSLSLGIALSLPVASGLVNSAVFGHFVPLRMQSGQNLVQPLGQFPNPYGIEYSDDWTARYLAERGIEYQSAEADQHLTSWYFAMLRERPGLFFSNFAARLRFFAWFFKLPIHAVTVLLVLVAGIAFGARDERLQPVLVVLALATGYLIFFGWTNQLPRLVTPVHFLANLTICFLVVFAYIARSRASTEELSPS